MISFVISLAALIVGYVLYGRFVEKMFGPDPSRLTPAVTKADGVDFIPMPAWKLFMIQFLNIAGTGPIFGAIMGAKFGPSCYLWIVFGCIFAGAVHDYLSGMLSIRQEGAGLPEMVKSILGERWKTVTLIFSLVLLLQVGAVFVYSPAIILGDLAGFMPTPGASVMFWAVIIFIYYFIATMLPIDKVIGKIYPFFAFCLIFMAVSLGLCLFIKWPSIPEFWDGLQNRGPSVGVDGQSILPCLFITVACGAISGFHATQSPMMARCMKNEKLGRPIFYGSMITEGIIALIWAAISSWFFFDGGMDATGASSGLAPVVVTSVSKAWLGLFGGILAIIGVVAAPITTGDTALRSARLIAADFLKMEQKTTASRLMIAIPIFVITSLLLWFNIANKDGFNVIWRYFGLANQALSCIMLWTATVYFKTYHNDLRYLITFIPACFMTAICTTFLCVDQTGLHINGAATPWISCSVFGICMVLFFIFSNHRQKKQ